MTKFTPWSTVSAESRLAEIRKRIESNDPALKNVFTQTFLDHADQQSKASAANSHSPLSGAIVSVKDLFDVEGFVTKAGTLFMSDNPPATVDAPPVKHLRDAGAIFIGHTNMTELAYSGLGLNPHYGTPENALTPGCIPGGSTAGGAISVAQNIADIAIGTDTGGSLRIPAAFNGIVGFKPTQRTVSRTGCKALSRTLDSVGPMASSVYACELAYKTMSNGGYETGKTIKNEFIIPTNFGMDDLQAPVEAAFEQAVQQLQNRGYSVVRKPINALEKLKSLPVWQFASVESRAEYETAYQNKRELIDPRIAGHTRMGRADEVDAITYRQTLNQRAQLIEQYQHEMGKKILLMPTVPILPPTLLSMQSDDEFTRVNLQVLRNPSIANVMDCCSISLPMKHAGSTIGVMMTVCGGHDLSLLALASSCEFN